MEYIPMFWNSQGIGASIPAASALLTFNEPDLQGQANMTPQDAASAWPQVVQAAQAKNIGQIVSPADAGDTTWLDQFVSLCTGCRIDAIAVHLYADTLGAVQGKIQAFEKYNKPIWLTEFACFHGSGCSLAEQETFMKAVIPYLEGESHVARYAWFSGDNVPNSVISNGGQVTELGQIYVSLPSSCGQP
jgi:Glycosyl hydrolase catalytic core